jgi:flagellar biosynthesis component FlhA
MSNGLILLGFIAVIFGILVARFRRRLGIGGTLKTFVTAVCGFAIAVLLLWATNRH